MLVPGFKILLNYPDWFVLLCLICGIGYAGILYYKNRKDGFPAWLSKALGVIRFIVVTLLAMLLLGPLIERLTRQVEDPILVFVQDNSQSITALSDSSFESASFLSERDRFLESFRDKFDVSVYSFGESFREDRGMGEVTNDPDKPGAPGLFGDRITDLSEVFSGLDAHFSNRNVGAVILASDGIYNRGANPLYSSALSRYPVYTIALGDTVPRRDIMVTRVRHNRITYLGNSFPVEVHIEGRQSDGLTSRLTVSKGRDVLFNSQVRFDGDHYLETLSIELEADQPGIQRYSVELTAVDAEISLANNKQEFYIEVIDGRQKLLVLAHAPHPDVGAIRQALEANGNYEVTGSLLSSFEGNVEAYNLIIMHQLPAANANMTPLFQQIRRAGIPVLFVIGKQTNLNAFNALQTGFNITPLSTDLVEVLAVPNPSFALFTLPDKSVNLFPGLPPLFAPFARYETSTSSQELLVQKIGQVVTQNPLIAFSQSENNKTGLISGEGIWRWRLQAFLRDNNHESFDDLISRMVQYLSLQEDKNLFRVRTAQFIYENEQVLFEGELYNRSYELVNEPEVRIVITNEDNVSFPYVMARTSNAYQLSAGSFPPGDYTYRANTALGAEQFQVDGRFSISPLNIELLRTVADHRLLYQLANNSSGEMFFPNQWDELKAHILSRDDIKTVLYARKSLDEIINMKGIFFLFLLLLSLEWFIRKRAGSY